MGTPLRVTLTTFRHPGLAPGPIQTTRDIKSTTSRCSKDPEYRGAISGRRGVSYKIPDIRYAIPGRQPLGIPGLVPGSPGQRSM